MAGPRSIKTQVEEIGQEQSTTHHTFPPEEESQGHLLDRLSHEVFKHDCLDRRLKRHHITGEF